MTDGECSSKRCGMCEEIKPLDEFHNETKRKGGKSARCKACACAVTAKWRAENRERHALQRAEHYRQNRDEIRLRENEKRRMAPEKHRASSKRWAEANRERKAINDKRWREANPHKVKAGRMPSAHKRRAAEGNFTSADVVQIIRSQRFKCAICKSSIRKEFQVDHIVPVTKGGTNWPNNLQALCKPCNLRKFNKDPVDHMRDLGFLL